MLKKLFVIVFLLLIGALQIFAQDEINPVKWSLKIETPVKSVNKGDTFNAVLSAKIDDGWHLYALEKIEGGPFPTRISVPDDALFELSKIDAPPPIEFDDSAFGVITKFYENAVNFGLPLKAKENVDKDLFNLKIKVRFQVCNDQMCLPPTTVAVESGAKKEPAAQ
ncbi:MAG: protein-disulfide reductase DsbD N-terminal domain-containing protein [Pyrinomonadaceae bacterium]